jgi:hypothetical protein
MSYHHNMRLVLITISLVTTLAMSLPALKWLPGKLRWLFVGLAGIDLLWITLVVFEYPLDMDFWGWFFNSSAEHTGSAIIDSIGFKGFGTI